MRGSRRLERRMTQQTMRSLRRWLPVVLLIGMIISAWAAETLGELRSLVNTWEFVASFATKCDIELSVRGLLGLQEHDCQVFFTEVNRANNDLQASRDTFLATAKAVDQSGNRDLQQKWNHAMDRLNRSQEHVTRTREHIEFLRKAETDTPKTPGKRPKK
jgi:hypothetical protein